MNSGCFLSLCCRLSTRQNANSIGDVLAPSTQVLPKIVSQKRGAKSSFEDLYEANTEAAGRQLPSWSIVEFIAGIILCGHQAGWQIADGAVVGVSLKQLDAA